MPFATWLDLEDVLCLVRCQSEKNKYLIFLLTCGIQKQNEGPDRKGNRLRDTENQQVVAREEEMEK